MKTSLPTLQGSSKDSICRHQVVGTGRFTWLHPLQDRFCSPGMMRRERWIGEICCRDFLKVVVSLLCGPLLFVARWPFSSLIPKNCLLNETAAATFSFNATTWSLLDHFARAADGALYPRRAYLRVEISERFYVVAVSYITTFASVNSLRSSWSWSVSWCSHCRETSDGGHFYVRLFRR